MIRPIFAAVAATMLMAAAPVFAADMNSDSNMNAMTCQAMMTKAQPMMASATDSANKTQAMDEMNMAKSSMAKNDEAGCKTHMEKAMGMMK
jgi:hypothetical protein